MAPLLAHFFLCIFSALRNVLFHSHVCFQVFFKVEKIRNLHLYVHLEDFRSSFEVGPSLLGETKGKTDETKRDISSEISVLACPYYI